MTIDEHDLNSPYVLLFFSPLVINYKEHWGSYIVLPQPVSHPAEELLNL